MTTPLPFKHAAALAVLSGVFYWGAFPGTDVWPLAFVCWAPLLVALRGQTPRRALLLGLLQGLTCNLLGFYWLLTMLQTFSGFPLPLCALFMLILCAYQGGRMAFMAWLHGRATQKGWPPGAVFVGALAGSELLYPLLFPWYTGAQTHKVPVLMQLADVGGPIAIGIALAGGSIVVAEVAWAKMDRRPFDKVRLALGAAGPVLLLLYGAVRLPMVQKAVDAAPKARVGLVQGNLALTGTEKRDAARIHRDLTKTLEQQGKLDLVVWSETAINFLIPEAILPSVMQRMVLSAPDKKLETPVLTGVILARGGPTRKQGGKLYNSAALAHPDGRIEGTYDKTYLLAFGEYIPFGETFPQLYEMSPNSGMLTPGKSLEPIPFGSHKITTLICYEDILPRFTNTIVTHGDPDLIVNMTNDAWFGKSTEPAIHLALAKYRAVEHRRFLVRATNSGVSAFIDPLGRTAEETPIFEEAARVSDVRWMRSKTAYEVLGDGPAGLLALLVIVGGFVARKGAKEAPPAPAQEPAATSPESV